MSINSLTWSRERMEQLKQCFSAGHLQPDRARDRSDPQPVIGKMNRMGLSQPRDPARTRRAAKPARTGSKTRWRPFSVIDQRKLLRDAFPQARAEEIPIHNGRGCTLLEVAQTDAAGRSTIRARRTFAIAATRRSTAGPIARATRASLTGAQAGAARKSRKTPGCRSARGRGSARGCRACPRRC